MARRIPTVPYSTPSLESLEDHSGPLAEGTRPSRARSSERRARKIAVTGAREAHVPMSLAFFVGALLAATFATALLLAVRAASAPHRR